MLTHQGRKAGELRPTEVGLGLLTLISVDFQILVKLFTLNSRKFA